MVNKYEWLVEPAEICKILQNNGYDGVFAGGAVRDLIIFRTKPNDVDIATNAHPDVIKKIFDEHGYKTILVGAKFGTIKVVNPKSNNPIEITTYRSESDYLDRRHPDKVFFESSMIKDSERRDFTINAMYYDPVSGELFDFHNGKKDGKDKIIRTVGNSLERFDEDPLRIMRAIRFASKYEFTIDNETYSAINHSYGLLAEVSGERIFDELMKIMKLRDILPALTRLYNTYILHIILPEVARLEGIEQPIMYHCYDALWHSFYATAEISPNKPLLRLATLLHDIGKIRSNPIPPPYFPDHIKLGRNIVVSVFNRFNLSCDDQRYIVFMIRHHMDDLQYQNASRATIHKYLSKLVSSGKEKYLPDLFDLLYADCKGTGYKTQDRFQKIDRFVNLVNILLKEEPILTLRNLAVNGHDLISVGITGKKIGEILNILLDEVLIDSTKNNKGYLLRRIVELNMNA
jgi:tRNA nucleotidyltransferase (CCA-adding enzyme)